jgi:hypothetical protein
MPRSPKRSPVTRRPPPNGAFLAAVKALLARLAANPQALAGFLGLIGSLVSALSGGQSVTSPGPVPAQDVSGVVTAEPS